MRKRLADLCDAQKHKFFAHIVRYGTYCDGDALRRTMLLQDVEDEDGSLLAEHCWVSMSKKVEKSCLQPGEYISFMARVVPYAKGDSGHDFSLKDLSFIERIPEDALSASAFKSVCDMFDEIQSQIEKEAFEIVKPLPRSFTFGEVYRISTGDENYFYGCVIDTMVDQFGEECVIFLRVMDPSKIYHYNPDSVVPIFVSGKPLVINARQQIILTEDLASKTPEFVIPDAVAASLKKALLGSISINEDVRDCDIPKDECDDVFAEEEASEESCNEEAEGCHDVTDPSEEETIYMDEKDIEIQNLEAKIEAYTDVIRILIDKIAEVRSDN